MHSLAEQYKQLKQRIDLLENIIHELMASGSIPAKQARDIELQAIINQCSKSLNYKPLREYLSRSSSSARLNGCP